MIVIDRRPDEVDGRLVPGHWEVDMIMGAGNRSAIGTLVERFTRYTLLVKLEFKDTDYTCVSFANAINIYAELLRRTMTCDQGKELSNHSTFTHGNVRSQGLLLRLEVAVAEGHQREYERPAPPILSEGNGFAHILSRRTRSHPG